MDVNNNFLNEQIDEIYEEELAVATEDEQTQFILSEAIKRIEQAKLYETLLKHQLFGQGSARPEIISAVEKEIKQFILNRLEILLGLKQEKPPQASATSFASPFSSDQVEALTALADKLLSRKENETPSFSAVTQPTVNTVEASSQELNVVRPTVNVAYNKPVLNSVGSGQPAPKKRRKRSENVSQVVVERRDGTKEVIDQDYSQAINPKSPPVRMPSQSQMDQMNAQQVSRKQGPMGA